MYMCECLSIYVFVYLRVYEYEGVWGVLDRKLKGHVCVNVDYSFFYNAFEFSWFGFLCSSVYTYDNVLVYV